jgi:Sulfatase
VSPAPRDGLGRRALELAILCAFAFAQPLFDLLGRNPEFFAVRGSPSSDIVLFAVGLVLLPPLVLSALEALAGLAATRARDIAHAVFVALLGALIAIQLVKRIGALPAGIDLALAVAAGLILAWRIGLRRGRVERTFVTVLSPAPLLFLALFLLGSSVTQLVLPRHAAVAAVGARAGAPVVMVVFDEFPLTSLLGRDGRIDPVRYPNFAALAAHSTWYSRATTVFDYTTQAVPAILDGRSPRKGSLPTLAQHPRNLFTLLGGSYRLNVSEDATHLCPRSLCPDATQPDRARRLRSLSLDSGVIYAHLVLPAALEDSLPSVSEGWGDFAGGDGGGAAVRALLGGGGRAARFEDWVRSIRPSSRPALDFKHVLLPHVPYEYLPDGHAYERGGGRPPGLAGPQGARDPFLVEQRYQRHLLQVGYTDRLLGRLIARLRETGLWNRALVVVAADHGVSFRVGQEDGRSVTPENVEDIAPVPLFIKSPGQRQGRITTRPVETIDILPTIADELGVRLPWQVDGRSARKSPPGGRAAVDMLSRAGPRIRLGAADLERRMGAALARKLSLFGSGSEGPGLYAVGAHRELVGRMVGELGAADAAGASVAIDAVSELADVNLNGRLPAQLSGRISGAGSGRHDLALALNGRVVTVSRSFPWEGQERFSAFAPADAFRSGRNVVEVLLVDASGQLRRLEDDS